MLLACLPFLVDLRWATVAQGFLLPFGIVAVAEIIFRVFLMGREAFAEPADGRARLSTVTPGRLTDHLPGWWLILLAALPATVAAVTWQDQATLGPTFSALLVAGCVVTVLGFGAAAWLVRQPQIAHTGSDIRWNTYRRSLDANTLASLGALLTLAAAWFLLAILRPEGPLPWWAWPAPMAVFILNWVGAALIQRRRDAASPAPANAQRQEQESTDAPR